MDVHQTDKLKMEPLEKEDLQPLKVYAQMFEEMEKLLSVLLVIAMMAIAMILMADQMLEKFNMDTLVQEEDFHLQAVVLKFEEMESGLILSLTIEMMATLIIQMDEIQIELLNPNGFEKMELRLLQINEEMTEVMVLLLVLHQTIVMMATMMILMAALQHDNLKSIGIELLDHPQKPVYELIFEEMEGSWIHMMVGETMATMMMKMAATSSEMLSLDGHELWEIMKQQVSVQILEEMESLSREISNIVMMATWIQEMDDQMSEVLRKAGCELEVTRKIQVHAIDANH